MAIEFHCPECSKLLSVPDGSEGRQARCPSCSAVCDVPAAASASAESEPTSGESEPPEPNSSSAFVDNPYAAPSVEISASDIPRTIGTETDRDGPAWERDGKSVASFIDTVKEMFSGPGLFFRRMRRSGGHWAPLGFGMVGGGIGMVIGLIWERIVEGNLALNQPVDKFELPFLLVVSLPLIFVSLYFHAGIVHLMLLMFGGAKQRFETTFRVMAYTTGATSLLMIIPVLGNIVLMVTHTVLLIIALAEAQEISRGKAAAVLIPMAVGFGVVVLASVLFLASFELPGPG